MKIINNKIKYEEGEPCLRSCPRCNPSHKHLLDTAVLHNCFGCGVWWIYNKYLDQFNTEQEVINFIKENEE